MAIAKILLPLQNHILIIINSQNKFLSGMTQMQKELEDKITIAICNWLNKKEQKQSIGDIDYLVKNIQNDTSSKETVKRIFELAHSIEDEVLRFFEIIYDNDSDEINIDSKSESDLDRTVVWNIFENYLEAINIKNSKTTLNSGIEELFSKYSSYTDDNLTILLKNAKEHRNTVHKGHHTKEALAEVWRNQAISLYIIAFVFKAPQTKEGKPGNKNKEKSDFLNILSLWYKNHNKRFDGLPLRYVKDYFDDSNKVILKILEIIKNDIQLKGTLNQFLQLVDMNGEIKESESVNLHLSPSTFLEKYLMQANLTIYKDAFAEIGNDVSWERGIDLLKKLCSHITHFDKIVFDKISLDYEKSVSYNNTTQISEECANFINNHFFKLLFIIGSLKIAIERNRTGVLFYANNDIDVLPYKKANSPISVKKEVPCYYHQDRLFERRKYNTINNEINAFRGDFSLDNVSNRSICIRRNRWTIVILDFPPRKEGQIKEIITNVKFPGLIDLESKGNENEQQIQVAIKNTQESQEKQKECPNGTSQQFNELPIHCLEDLRRVFAPSTNSTQVDSHNSQDANNKTKKDDMSFQTLMDIQKGLFPHKDEDSIENEKDSQDDLETKKALTFKEESKEKKWDLDRLSDIELINAILHYCCEDKYYSHNDGFINSDTSHRRLMQITYESFMELAKSGQIDMSYILSIVEIHCTTLDFEPRKTHNGESVVDIDYMYADLHTEASELKNAFYNFDKTRNLIINNMCDKFHNKQFQELLLSLKRNIEMDYKKRVILNNKLTYQRLLNDLRDILSLQNLSKCITFVNCPRNIRQESFEYKIENAIYESIYDYPIFKGGCNYLIGFSQNNLNNKTEIHLSGKYFFRNKIRQTENLHLLANDYQEFIFNRLSLDNSHTLKEKFLHILGKF